MGKSEASCLSRRWVAECTSSARSPATLLFTLHFSLLDHFALGAWALTAWLLSHAAFHVMFLRTLLLECAAFVLGTVRASGQRPHLVDLVCTSVRAKLYIDMLG